MTGLDTVSNFPGFSWKGRSIFITGAAGFVGSWLSESLARHGAHVTNLVLAGDEEDRWRSLLHFDRLKVVTGRVEDVAGVERILNESNADTVFHLAAINVNVGKSVSPIEIFETNIRGTWSVLEACRRTPGVRRVVVASSREAEESRENQPTDTIQSPRRKRHPYQVSKMSAELVAQAYSDTYDMPIAISRADNIYGGRDLNWNRLIPGTVRSILNGVAPSLRSDGTLARDYVYVDDIVIAYLNLAARAQDPGIRGEVFHFATGIGTSALAIITQLCEIAGRPDLRPVILNQSTGERVNKERSTARERDLLGWTSRIGIQEGLRSTFEWYQSYFGSEIAHY